MLFVDGQITFEPKLVIVAPFSVDFLIVFQGFLHLRFPVGTGYMTLREPVAKSNGDFLGTANDQDFDLEILSHQAFERLLIYVRTLRIIRDKFHKSYLIYCIE